MHLFDSLFASIKRLFTWLFSTNKEQEKSSVELLYHDAPLNSDEGSMLHPFFDDTLYDYEAVKKELYSVYIFYNEYINDISFFDFNDILIVTDMKAYLKSEGIENASMQAGATMPRMSNGCFQVIIDVSNNDSENSIVLMHELTHIYDFEKYLQHHKCRDKERETRTLPNYHGFFAYTEFHASFCSEFFYAKYLTFLWEKDVEAIARPEFISSLDQYIAIKKQEISDGTFSNHALEQLLGKFLILDMYNNIDQIEKSCVYQFAPQLFESPKTEFVIQLFLLFRDALVNMNVFADLAYIENALFQLNAV